MPQDESREIRMLQIKSLEEIKNWVRFEKKC